MNIEKLGHEGAVYGSFLSLVVLRYECNIFLLGPVSQDTILDFPNCIGETKKSTCLTIWQS